MSLLWTRTAPRCGAEGKDNVVSTPMGTAGLLHPGASATGSAAGVRPQVGFRVDGGYSVHRSERPGYITRLATLAELEGRKDKHFARRSALWLGLTVGIVALLAAGRAGCDTPGDHNGPEEVRMGVIR